MKKTFAVYGIGYLVLLIVVLGLMYVHPKLELHLMLNSHHSPILDTFFHLLLHLGGMAHLHIGTATRILEGIQIDHLLRSL